MNYLSSNSEEKWSPEEDLLLLNLYADHGPSWSWYSRWRFPNRSADSIKNRYSFLQKNKTPNKDVEKIIKAEPDLVKEKNFADIAKYTRGWTPDELEEVAFDLGVKGDGIANTNYASQKSANFILEYMTNDGDIKNTSQSLGMTIDKANEFLKKLDNNFGNKEILKTIEWNAFAEARVCSQVKPYSKTIGTKTTTKLHKSH